MKTKINLAALLLTMGIGQAMAQQSGNSVYGQNAGFVMGKADPTGKLWLNDSSFIIQATVAKNVIADNYVVTFGLSEEAKTVAECNDKIDKRIKNFIADIAKLGIKESDIFIDMTTQNKVFDYTTEKEQETQYLKGFDLKKNVIISFKDIHQLDQMVLAAAKYEIYDMVKVDYNVSDLSKIYADLFRAAKEVIDQKKGLYIEATQMSVDPQSMIYNEQLYSFYPAQLYKSYTAYEAVETYYSNPIKKKDIRKSPTFYYDKMSYSGFDKVLNPNVVAPAVEFCLSLQIKFQLK
jgi:uncharacterized protein YggE